MPSHQRTPKPAYDAVFAALDADPRLSRVNAQHAKHAVEALRDNDPDVYPAPEPAPSTTLAGAVARVLDSIDRDLHLHDTQLLGVREAVQVVADAIGQGVGDEVRSILHPLAVPSQDGGS